MAPARIEEPCPGRYASSDRVTTTILRKPAIVRSMVVAGLAPVMPITFDLWWNLYTQIYLSAPVLPIQNGYLFDEQAQAVDGGRPRCEDRNLPR